MKKIDPKVDEAIQTLNMKDGPSRRKLLTGTGLVSATAAASALLAACTSSSTSSGTVEDDAVGRGRGRGQLPEDPAWKFWFVNHVTTNAFFTPTQYGLADAAALLGLPTPVWGGSNNSVISDMVVHLRHRDRRGRGRHRAGRHQRHGVHGPGRERHDARASRS